MQEFKGNIKLPKHVAIIMDGNNRWAREKGLPGVSGHKEGVSRAREAVEHAVKRDLDVLTLFAFSSENWGRSDEEVNLLMELLAVALEDEVPNLIKNSVQLKFIGDLKRFDKELKQKMKSAEKKTKLSEKSKRLDLIIAASYGGRWDIVEAVKKITVNQNSNSDITEKNFKQFMSLSDTPDPDICIRTGGERRLSNFLLWQLAYSELYFTNVLWPDFDSQELDIALDEFSKRNRRYGDTSNF